jgi:SHS2 domain-containing protein
MAKTSEDVIVKGDTPQALFQNAALALSAFLVDPGSVSPGGLRDRWRATGVDAKDLMTRWGEEVFFQIAKNRVIPAQVSVFRVDMPAVGPCVVEAEVDGELLDPGRHEVLRSDASLRAVLMNKTGAGWETRLSMEGTPAAGS